MAWRVVALAAVLHNSPMAAAFTTPRAPHPTALAVLQNSPTAAAFTTPPAPHRHHPGRLRPTAAIHSPSAAAVRTLRGGTVQATAVQAAIASAISGAYAVPAAAAIAGVAGTLCYIRQAYIFSLSYGLFMLGIGIAALASPAASASALLKVHAALVAAYGLRLFLFLFWRQQFQPGYDGMAKLKALDKTPRLKRTPIILSTAFFYALMASPLLFHIKAQPMLGAAAAISKLGSVLAAIGLVYEAVADQQKSLFKMGLRADGKEDALFTSGVYSRSRHANYAGEILFWVGSFIAGAPAISAVGLSLATRASRTVCSALGLYGIIFIMLSATKRLEGRQQDKYGATPEYEAYLESTNALFPKV